MNKLAEQIIVDVIANQMGLANDRVWIREQNKVIPNDNNLYVVVGMVDAKPLGTSNDIVYTPIPDTDPVEYDAKEVQRVLSQEFIQIDIASRNKDAVLRRWEIIAALHSIYCQQKQEEQGFKVFRIPRAFNETGGAEGGSLINRFTIVVCCHVLFIKENNLPEYDYYDDFKTRVDDEESIGTDHGIIEFRIHDNEFIPYGG